jgi:hypothetical protein
MNHASMEDKVKPPAAIANATTKATTIDAKQASHDKGAEAKV